MRCARERDRQTDPGLHCLCLEPPVASGQWGELGAWSTQAGHLPEQGRQGEAVRGSGHDRVGGTLFPCATEGGVRCYQTS